MVNTNSIEKLITYQFNRENPFRPNYNTASEVIPDINMHEEKKSGIHGKLIYYINHLIITVITGISWSFCRLAEEKKLQAMQLLLLWSYSKDKPFNFAAALLGLLYIHDIQD